MATQEQLLAALGAAHQAGDTQAAVQIAQLISSGQYDPSKAPDKIATPGGDSPGGAPAGSQSALERYGNAVAGPLEGAAHIASGAVAGPVAGYAGMGADIAHLFGANVDPSAVIGKVQNALTYQPRSQGGKDTAAAIDKVGGLIPEGANWAGEHVTDATGSPALGTAVNAGLQGLGMWATGKIPAAGAALRDAPVIKPALTFASDVLPGGAERAKVRLLKQYAGSGGGDAASAAVNIRDHLAAQEALSKAGRSGALAPDGMPIPSTGPQDLLTKYGISPTTAQVAGNAGLAQMDRTLRNSTELTTPFNDRDSMNQNAVHNILEGISGSPEDRLRAGAARDFRARTMYDDALNNPDHFVQPPTADTPSFAAEEAAKRGLPNADGTPSTNDPNAPAQGLNDVGMRLQDLLKRPAMQDAMTNASRVAANFGKKLDNRNLIQQMHYAKMHLDDQIGAAQASGKTNDFRSLLDTKNELLGVMDDLSPAYADARKSFSTASAPINRMEVGEALRQKYMSALADAGGTGTRPAMFADALRKDNGDQIARTATGFNGATLEGTLTPEDISGLQAARDQLGRQQFAQNAGRGVGSNTGQNLVNQRALDNVGSLNQISEDLGPAAGYAAAMTHPAIAVPTAIAGGIARRGVRAKLAEAALDPAVAARALEQKPLAGIPEEITMPASVGANEDSKAEGHADGGEVKKSSFWDLVQQAVKEISSPSPDAQAPASPDAGSVAFGTKGADFDRYVNAGVAANGG